MLAEEMWQKYLDTKDDKWKQELTVEYLPLVKEIARRMSMGLPGHVEYDDLVSWGVIGLLDALEKYKPDKGSQFKSYAAVRIKGAILDELRRFSWVPRSLLQNMKKIEEGFRSLENKLGREATPREVADYMGVSSSFINKTLNQVNHSSVVSLETVLFNSEDSQSTKYLRDTVSCKEKGPEEHLETKERSMLLKEALDNLSKRDKLVLSLYYYEELTMKEIGEVMSLSESRVSQIHSRAVMKLKRYLSREHQEGR